MDSASHPLHSPPFNTASGPPSGATASAPIQSHLTLVPPTSTGPDRKRRLTSPESPGRRGNEPGSSLANVIDLTTDSPQRAVDLRPRESEEGAAGSSRMSAIDLTGGQDTSPPSRPTVAGRIVPQRPGPTETILRRTSSGGPSRTFDDIAIPPWQPDAEAIHCSVCGTPFTFFFRRHHCRKCGKVVCDNCSPHRITLPRQYIVRNPADEDIPTASTAWGGERVRVCNPCVPDPNFDPPRPHSASQQQESQNQINAPRAPPHPGTSLSSVPGMFRPLRPPPPPGLGSRHRPSSSLSNIPMPSDQDIGSDLERYRPRRPTIPPPSGPNNILPSGSNFFPPHVSGAIAPFATGPAPYPPSPPGSPPVEVCRRCGMLLPFRAPDGSTDFVRNAHFAGQCGSATRARQDVPPSVHPQEPRPPRGTYAPHSGIFGNYGAFTTPPPSSSAPLPRPNAPLPPFPGLAVAPHIRRNLLDPSSSSSSSSSASASQQQTPSGLGQHNRSASASASFSAGTSANTSDARVAAAFAPVPAMATYPATEKDCVNADGEVCECVICLEEFEVGDELGMLECFCKFHRRCIVEWYEKGSGMCPTHKVLEGFAG